MWVSMGMHGRKCQLQHSPRLHKNDDEGSGWRKEHKRKQFVDHDVDFAVPADEFD
jgi:hypothetical protein